MLELLLEATLRSLALGTVVWVFLKAFRIRDPYIHLSVWTVVLAGSLAMPLLMRAIEITPSIPAPVLRWDALTFFRASSFGAFSMPAYFNRFDIFRALLIVYLGVATLMFVRSIAGIIITSSLRNTAKPIQEDWIEDSEVRVSTSIDAPMTFGSTILVPSNYVEWSAFKKQAVLLHEQSHVDRGDFYVQALATLCRTIFWFNPLTWWIHKRLVELAETVSDAVAIAKLGDSVSYTELLFDLASKPQRRLVGIHMARSNAVSDRINYILAGKNLPRRVIWKYQILAIGMIFPLIVAVAGFSEPSAKAEVASPVQKTQLASETLKPVPLSNVRENADLSCTFSHPVQDIGSLKQLPDSIVALLPSGMADRDQPFRNGDVVLSGDDRASRRFIRGGHFGAYWFVWFEQGGIAYSKQTILYELPTIGGQPHLVTKKIGVGCVTTDAFLTAQGDTKHSAQDDLSAGLKYYQNQDYSNAIAAFDRLVALHPDGAEGFLARGDVYFAMQQYDRAIPDYRKAVKSDPGLTRAFDRIGFADLQLSQFDDAEKNYDYVIARSAVLSPSGYDVAEALYGRGLAKRAKGNVAGGNEDMLAAKNINAKIADRFSGHGLVAEQKASPSSPPHAPLADTDNLQEQTSPVAASSPDAPHIDAVNLKEQVVASGALVIIQEIVFRAPKGDAKSWHNEVLNTSTPAPAIRLSDGLIFVSRKQQQRGAIADARYNCGVDRDTYSFTKRITITGADGEKSNSYDVTINCH